MYLLKFVAFMFFDAQFKMSSDRSFYLNMIWLYYAYDLPDMGFSTCNCMIWTEVILLFWYLCQWPDVHKHECMLSYCIPTEIYHTGSSSYLVIVFYLWIWIIVESELDICNELCCVLSLKKGIKKYFFSV
jgi:hypothetical protein